MRWLLLVSVVLLLLTGALGLSFDIGECDAFERVSHKIQCYHKVAISYAYAADKGTAENICEDIWLKFGSGRDPSDDMVKKAELISNTCFYDVAKIARDPAICNGISERYATGTSLLGGEVTRDTCIREADRLAGIKPENYYRDNPDNLCALVFVLPLLFFSILGIRMGSRP